MEFERVIISRVDPQEHREPVTSEHIFAEVVFLNKTHHSLQPLLYQLNEEHLENMDQIANSPQIMPTHVEKEAFTLVGEVLSINKKKKEIYLNNQNTITYRYLIVVGSANNHPSNTLTTEAQFTGGIHTLIDALRMRENVLLSIPTVDLGKKKNDPHRVKIYSTQDISAEKSLDHVARRGMGPSLKEMISLSLVQSEKKLYEVQL